jgi:hypothetical protein
MLTFIFEEYGRGVEVKTKPSDEGKIESEAMKVIESLSQIANPRKTNTKSAIKIQNQMDENCQ